MGRQTTGVLYKRGKVYWLAYTYQGKRHQVSLGVTTEAEAERERAKRIAPFTTGSKAAMAEHLAALARAAVDGNRQATTEARDAIVQAATDKRRLLLSESWAKYVGCDVEEKPDTGEATLRQYSFQWGAFVTWMQGRSGAAVALDDVSPLVVREYRRHLASRLGSGTVNKHITLCRLVCGVLQLVVAREVAVAAGQDEQLVSPPLNPFAEAFRGLKTKRGAKRQTSRKMIPLDKLAKACDLAQGEMRRLLFIGLYTGARLGDCCTLTWDAVDMASGVISIVPRKVARHVEDPIQIPIADHLQPILEATPAEARIGYVLPELAELYNRGRVDTITDRIQALLSTAGLQLYRSGTGPGTEKRAVLQYGFHSLRHNFVSWLEQRGASRRDVMELVGHQSPAITDVYSKPNLDALRAAVGMLPAMVKAPSTPALPGPVEQAADIAGAAARLRAWAGKARLSKAVRADLLAVLATVKA